VRMARPDFESVQAYLASLPEPTRRALAKARATIKRALPRATEGISYRIPIFRIDGAMVLFLAGFARHYSIYPLTPALSRELSDELAPRIRSKTIRFTLDEPVPVALITRIAKVRAAEVAKGPAKKKSVQPAKRAARRSK
jgi:uncharacterized protein YdhG (YjbR/CyaY superfamily)